MPSYPSLYRARATRWTGSALQVLIPQVFGEAIVDVIDFLNEPTTGMGWVMFQGGNCEFPVWLGPLTTPVEIDIPPYPEFPVIPDEVLVSPTEPTDTNVELWYDTDAVVPPTVPPAWTNLTLLNGWAQYSSPYGPAQYRKVGDIVYLRGLILGGTVGAAMTIMPDGYRTPVGTEPIFICMNNLTLCDVRVQSSGAIIQNGGNNAWLSLAGIIYSVT